jgi:hypothetical protein
VRDRYDLIGVYVDSRYYDYGFGWFNAMSVDKVNTYVGAVIMKYCRFYLALVSPNGAVAFDKRLFQLHRDRSSHGQHEEEGKDDQVELLH